MERIGIVYFWPCVSVSVDGLFDHRANQRHTPLMPPTNNWLILFTCGRARGGFNARNK